MNEYRVVIPEESYSILEFHQEDLPGIAVVNTGLRGFEPKLVFGWHLSLMLQLDELLEKGMPSTAEREIVDAFGETLNESLLGEDLEKPNALFLARITWHGTRELIWRVFDPEVANPYLQSIVNGDAAIRPRAFEYRMDHDPQWSRTEWLLKEYAGPDGAESN